MTPTRGRLLLVPAPLDFGCTPQAPMTDVLPQATLVAAASLRFWIAENAKTARACIKRIAEQVPLGVPLQEQSITEMPRDMHKRADTGTGAGQDARRLLAPALEGHDIGLISEAGMPAVADPGVSVVRAAHDLGLQVVPLVGPSSLLLALAASGLNGQNFAFVGYLPQEAAARAVRLKELETLAHRTGQAQLFIETPYRNAALIAALLSTLRPETRLSVSTGLTLAQASTRSAPVSAWKRDPQGAVGDGPAVFVIGP